MQNYETSSEETTSWTSWRESTNSGIWVIWRLEGPSTVLHKLRSNLECCSAAWSPCSRTNIYNLEGPQRRATKFVLKSEDRYKNRLEKLDLLSLKKQESFNCCNLLFKVLKGLIDIDVSHFLDFYSNCSYYSFNHNDHLMLKKKYARTNTLKYSYFHRIGNAEYFASRHPYCILYWEF